MREFDVITGIDEARACVADLRAAAEAIETAAAAQQAAVVDDAMLLSAATQIARFALPRLLHHVPPDQLRVEVFVNGSLV